MYGIAILPSITLNINNQQSTINNQQSTINNQQSTINNQQSTINNQNVQVVQAFALCTGSAFMFFTLCVVLCLEIHKLAST